MNPMQIILMLRAHYRIALVVFVLTIGAGVGITLWTPKQYSTTTAVVFDVKQDPIAGIAPTLLGFFATQVEIIKSDRVAQRVVRMLSLNEHPGLKQQWLAATGGKAKMDIWVGELLQKGLQVSPVTGSNIVNISYRAADPAFATLVANAFAQAYIETSIELRVDPARQYSQWFSEQGKSMRENLEKAQARLSEFQQSKGIVAREEQMDAEMAKLTDLTARLTAVQEQTSDAASKQKSGADTLPEVLQNSVVVGLRTEIGRQEARLQEIAGNVGKNHPQYQRMESEIAALKQKLEVETKHVASSFSTSRTISRDRETELRAAIAAQKKKLLELRSERDQLAVLQRDVDAAQSAYAAVTSRYNQSSLESQVTQTNVSVLNPAIEPLEPSSPNIKKNMAISVMLGILLGGAAAFLLELIDRRIRSADDLSDMLQLPVLAIIEKPRHPHKLLFWRRTPRLALK